MERQWVDFTSGMAMTPTAMGVAMIDQRRRSGLTPNRYRRRSRISPAAWTRYSVKTGGNPKSLTLGKSV